MKKTVSIVTGLSIILALCVNFTTYAQKPTREDPKPLSLPPGVVKNWDKLPPQLKQALTPEAKAGWDRFTPKQQEKIKAKLVEIIRNAKSSLATPPVGYADNEPQQVDLNYVDRAGKHQVMKAKPGHRDRAGARLRAPGKNAVWQTEWAKQLPSKGKSHHARVSLPAGNPQSGCTRGPEQFLRTFFEMSLARPPHADELSYWMNEFAAAQSQGALLTTAQNLGYTVFESSEYAGRGRSNREFVYDCYRAYLQRDPDQSGWDFWTANADSVGRVPTLVAFAVCTEFNDLVSGICNVATFDGDHDGLPDNFENNLADNFTPYYHVSLYETDNYATFENFVPQTVKSRFGTTPVSHFRVVPLSGSAGPIRYNYVSGRWESFLRIDYWTMWDHDSGLVGDLCGIAPGEDFLVAAEAHDLDDERSALLVSAPAVWNGSEFVINLDPNAYSSISLYTAAHENRIFQHNFYYDFPESPRPAGDRFELWQALSKHSTYSFNPDYFPLFQIWQIVLIESIVTTWLATRNCTGSIDEFWIELFGDDAYGWSCDTWLAVGVAMQYYLAVMFITCVVERFYDGLPAQLANIRINLGEPYNPINGSAFIQDDSNSVLSKLLLPLDFESLF